MNTPTQTVKIETLESFKNYVAEMKEKFTISNGLEIVELYMSALDLMQAPAEEIRKAVLLTNEEFHKVDALYKNR